MPKVKTPLFPILILDSTLCRLDSTFWLDSTLKLYSEQTYKLAWGLGSSHRRTICCLMRGGGKVSSFFS